jgi:hypothetical protein
MAANAGKMVREFRTIMDTAMNPVEQEIPDDFSSYYYESLARAGEEVPEEYDAEELDEYEVDEPYHNYRQIEESEPDVVDASVGAIPEASNGHAAAGTRRMVTRVVKPRTPPPA